MGCRLVRLPSTACKTSPLGAGPATPLSSSSICVLESVVTVTTTTPVAAIEAVKAPVAASVLTPAKDVVPTVPFVTA